MGHGKEVRAEFGKAASQAELKKALSRHARMGGF
jgi:hypothetical protein